MMVVKVFREDILEGLQKAASIIPAKTGAAFLRTIWLRAEGESLRIMSTDSSLEFCGRYKAHVSAEGLAGVQGRAFYDLMRKLPAGEIVLKVDEGSKNLLVEQDSRRYKLPVNDPSWFQPLADFPEEAATILAGDKLQEIIDKVVYCISDEDSMEAIACMNMVGRHMENGESVEICGLNGHQFAMVRFQDEEFVKLLPEAGLLIQKKYVLELRKWLPGTEVELTVTDKRIFFKYNGSRKSGERSVSFLEVFSLPLSNYQYPDYRGFLSKVQGEDNSTLSVDRPELLQTLDRIAIFNSENNRCVNFSMADGVLTLFSQGQDVGQASESLPAEFGGALDKISFPTRSLMDILAHFGSAKARFSLTGSEGPCGITGSEDPDYLVVIMPMKVVEETYYNEENE